MVAAVAFQSQTQPKNEQFYKLTLDALRQDYKAKVLNAETYLYYLIKARNKAGWEWIVNVKKFCAEWEIAKSTFYRALSNLREKNLIFWRPADNTVVIQWGKEVTKIANIHSGDSPSSPNPDTVVAVQLVRKPLQDVREQFQHIRQPLQDVREQNPQTLTVAQSCNPSYSLQIDSKINTDFHEEVCVVSEKLLDQEPECKQQSFGNFENFENEINQDAITGSPTTLLNNTEISGVVDITSDEGQAWAAAISDTEISQVANKTSDDGQGFAPTGCKNDEPNQDAIDESCTTLLGEAEALQVANKTSSEGKGFAPPIRKTSQKQKWLCPGTDEEKNEFLIFKGELLVAAKQCKSVEARTAALSWANHNLEAADLLWEDWQRQKVQDANQNTVRASAAPDFHRMQPEEHASLLEKFINLGGEEFLKLSSWHKHWMQFTTIPIAKQLIPSLTLQIIKQIRDALICQRV